MVDIPTLPDNIPYPLHDRSSCNSLWIFSSLWQYSYQMVPIYSVASIKFICQHVLSSFFQSKKRKSHLHAIPRILKVCIQNVLLYHPLSIEKRGIEGDAVLHDIHPSFPLSVIHWEDDIL